jgi:propanol-preferring alcohol dehydrogenase
LALTTLGISSSLAAVATDAVKTSYHAITRRAEVKPHETVFLFGLGGLGFNALQIVLHIGARVIVSDVRQERLDEAVRIGVPLQDVVPLNSSIRDFVQEKGLVIDTTLDFVGKRQTFQDAQNIRKCPRQTVHSTITDHVVVRRGGKMLCVGTLDVENTIDMKIGVRKRLTILFTYGGRRNDLEEVLDLIASGDIKPQVENALLRDFPRLLRELCDGRIKGRVALLHN